MSEAWVRPEGYDEGEDYWNYLLDNDPIKMRDEARRVERERDEARAALQRLNALARALSEDPS